MARETINCHYEDQELKQSSAALIHYTDGLLEEEKEVVVTSAKRLKDHSNGQQPISKDNRQWCETTTRHKYQQ